MNIKINMGTADGAWSTAGKSPEEIAREIVPGGHLGSEGIWARRDSSILI